MESGFIGSGRMGANMVRRLLQGGHSENAGPTGWLSPLRPCRLRTSR